MLYMFIPLYTSRRKKLPYPTKEKSITVLIPAFNEQLVIDNCLMGLLRVDYKNLEVIFINDGSTDHTLQNLQHKLQLTEASKEKLGLLEHELVHTVYQSKIHPSFWVLDKVNGGKADALNAGIEFAANEIVITLDADSILHKFALNEMNRAFSDEHVVAAGGLVNIVQGFQQKRTTFKPSFNIRGLIRYQIVQYLTAFYLHKWTQSKLGTMTVIAGAFGAFRKDVLLLANGYRKTVGEDMDITLRIQKLIGTSLKKKRIIFVPEAICYTECPSTFKNLLKQRIRWQKAFIDCIITYRKSFFTSFSIKVSIYLLLDSLLLGTLSAYPTLIVPIIFLLTFNHVQLTAMLFAMAVLLAILQDIAALLVSKRFGHRYRLKDKVAVLLFLPIEVIFYRISGLFFVTIGTILYFFDKDGWSRSERIGQPVLFDAEFDQSDSEALGGALHEKVHRI